MAKFKPGDRVLIKLEVVNPQAIIHRALEGNVGVVEGCNSDLGDIRELGFDYCVRVGALLVGLKESEMTLVKDEE